MTKLVWDNISDRLYAGGCDRGVLYVGSNPGVPWIGLTNVEEAPAGGEVKTYFLDGSNYLNVSAIEAFTAAVSAIYSPEEFDQCDGTYEVGRGLFVTQQNRKPFHLSYRTLLMNPIDGVDYGYKIHLVYNALAAPTTKPSSTLSDSMTVDPLVWNLTTCPVPIPNRRPSAHLIIDTTRSSPALVAQVEDILYGSDGGEPRMPTPAELINLFNEFVDLHNGYISAVNYEFTETDNGYGTADFETVDQSNGYLSIV